MTIPVALRGDFKASQLRGLARKTKDGPHGAAASLTLAAIYDGATPHRGGEDWRRDTADHPGLGDAVCQCAGGMPACFDGKAPGNPSRLIDVQRQAILRRVESGPIPAIHGVVRWRLIDLAQPCDLRGVPRHGRQTDAEPGASRDGLPQALRHDPAIMHKPREPSRIFLKNFPARLDKVARKSNRRRQDRNLVPGRGSYRPEEQDHPQGGAKRGTRLERASGSANRIDLYLRCHLPETGQGRGSDPALLQYHEAMETCTSRKSPRRSHQELPRRPPRRSGRMASVSKIAHSRQHHHSRPAVEMPRAQSG